jgi:hypothetical protein
VIPPHADKVTADGEPYHDRCWTRRQGGAAPTSAS